MRTFLTLQSLFILAAVVAASLTPLVWVALQPLDDVPVHRVLNRVGMLLLGVGTLLYLRKRGLLDKVALGYSMPRRRFVRHLLIGLAAGVLTMLPLAAAIFALGLRVPSQEFSPAAFPAVFVMSVMVKGMLTGLAVSFLEETYFRGAMFTAVIRESGLLPAIVLPTVFYAGLHFLGGMRVPNEEVTWLTGFYLAANLFDAYAAPLLLVDSFLALVAFGVLLSLVRHRTGAIAACIGVHMGGVAVIVSLHHLSIPNPAASFSWLVGTYDGVIGWMAFAWIGLLTGAYWYLNDGRRAGIRQRMSKFGSPPRPAVG
jgi:uncharacterized protein